MQGDVGRGKREDWDSAEENRPEDRIKGLKRKKMGIRGQEGKCGR